MTYKIYHIEGSITPQKITITGSKSESNRLLLLQAFFPQIEIKNLSNSQDTQVMQKALQANSNSIDVGHAGTAMRFLTSYFASKNNSHITLTGSERMKQRPIKILVDALLTLGATIFYEEKEGFPPLKIIGTSLKGGVVTIPANVSSQYISALLLLGATLQDGITLYLEGKITSRPYIEMTLSLLKKVGIASTFIEQTIHVKPQHSIAPVSVTVESDWSSASYFYSIIALSKAASITLGSFLEASVQGDREIAAIYKNLGVQTIFHKDGTITLSKTKLNTPPVSSLVLELNNTPDIAQTIAVTCFGLGMGCDLYGLHTLKIKETDRLEALKTELEKLGATIVISDDSFHLQPSQGINPQITIHTYDDHRMAMAFAPLGLLTTLYIDDPNVVSKSFPDFWEALKMLGFTID